jgi:hypothetical protein
MIALLDTSQDLDTAEAELGLVVGQLLTPLTQFKNRSSRQFAIDNGGFSGSQVGGFLSVLERERPNRGRCLFAAVPDVVGDARRTCELFEHWHWKMAGYPLAFVAQDGQQDMPIPWKLIDAIFIGGSTQWKLSRHAEAIIRCAQWQQKWVHVGRVNTPERFQKFEALGVDSIDGSGISQYSAMRHAIRLRDTSTQMALLQMNGDIHT